VSKQEIEKWLAAKSPEELESYFPQYPTPTSEEMGCPITSEEGIARAGGLCGVPPDVEALVYSRLGHPKERTRAELYSIVRAELRSAGITNVGFKISSYQGDPPFTGRSDAAIWRREDKSGFLVHLHPDLLWYPESHVRSTIRHELKHSLRPSDWEEE